MRFATTRWSLVLAAGNPAGHAALGELCELYWEPVYCYLRRRGNDPEEAMDLTQGFIARLLEKGGVGTAYRERGRFRNFLLGALNHYEANEAAKGRAQKRGGGITPISLDVSAVEDRLRAEPIDSKTPESEYLRAWALRLLDLAVGSLRNRYETDGASELFEKLLPTITADRKAGYRAMGDALGMSEDAVKMAASRFKKRYREQLRALVAETVAEPKDIDDELRSLIAALR